jgi:hypothetical protein
MHWLGPAQRAVLMSEWMMACCKLPANREFKSAATASRGGSTRHAQTVERQNDPICAPRLLIVEESPAAPNGGSASVLCAMSDYVR